MTRIGRDTLAQRAGRMAADRWHYETGCDPTSHRVTVRGLVTRTWGQRGEPLPILRMGWPVLICARRYLPGRGSICHPATRRAGNRRVCPAASGLPHEQPTWMLAVDVRPFATRQCLQHRIPPCSAAQKPPCLASPEISATDAASAVHITLQMSVLEGGQMGRRWIQGACVLSLTRPPRRTHICMLVPRLTAWWEGITRYSTCCCDVTKRVLRNPPPNPSRLAPRPPLTGAEIPFGLAQQLDRALDRAFAVFGSHCSVLGASALRYGRL